MPSATASLSAEGKKGGEEIGITFFPSLALSSKMAAEIDISFFLVDVREFQ
jgi:hypothetical protein